ncbi:MAG TPA: hypothetical protein VMZ92_18630 [Planctomycetota bacterium]|nr:hypothetical protein [Planctomycetota bacterium]
MNRAAGIFTLTALLMLISSASHAENLVENSSFEAGTGHGWGVSFGNWPSRVKWTSYLDHTTAAHGKYSLRIPTTRWEHRGAVVTRKNRLNIETKYYRLTSGGEYTLSLYMKATKPVLMRVGVLAHPDEAKSPADVYAFWKLVKIDTEWRRYHFTETLKPSPEGLYAVKVFYDSDDLDPAAVWIDAVQLEAGGLTDYAPRRPVEVGFVCDKPGHIFFEEEAASVTLRLWSAKPDVVTKLSCLIEDLTGRTLSKYTFKTDILGEGGNITFVLPKPKRGIYRALVSADDGRPAEFVYSVLPRPRHLDERFEGGLLGTDTHGLPENMALLKRAGYTWVISKMWGRWHRIEPAKGRFTFDDEEVNAAVDAKMNVLIQILWPEWGGPTWAIANTPHPEVAKGRREAWDAAKKTQFLRDVSDFTTAVVDHYKGRVKYYELSNEPYFNFTPEQFAEVSKAMAKAAKRADPDCVCVINTDYRIYTPLAGDDKKDRPSFFPLQLAASGPEVIDVVSAHFYVSERFWHIPWGEHLRKINKPGWNTETGGTGTHFYRTLPTLASARGGADYWTKTHLPVVLEQTDRYQKNLLLTLAPGGMEKYFHYFTRFTNCSPSQPTRRGGNGKENVEFDGTLRPGAVAQSVAAHFLEGCTYDAPLGVDERIEGYVMKGPAGSKGFFWSTEDRVLDLMLPAGGLVSFFDLMTNPVTPKTVDGKGRLRLAPVTTFFSSPLPPEALRAWFKRAEVKDTGQRQDASFAGNFEYE